MLYVVDIASHIAYRAFDCLRIWGITQHQWFPTIIVFTLGMFEPAINIFNYTTPLSFNIIPSGPLAGCWPFATTKEYVYIDSSWPSILRASSEARVQTTLTSTLLRNGSIQFGTLLVLNIIAVILDSLSVANIQEASISSLSNFIYFQQIFNSILLSHFILDLHSIYLTESNPGSQTNPRSTGMEFAASVQGNIAASLDISWATGEESERDIEEDEEIWYSNNPLTDGLLQDIGGGESDERTKISEVDKGLEVGPSGSVQTMNRSSASDLSTGDVQEIA
ncbi:hypothetical protein QCA50_014692 [Cerrena zonata]|uniref:Uncharacterized protein n=1 Tax=Cerrena zonata TaxID=2478898 RepID=A0AAW0FMP0_9APHY